MKRQVEKSWIEEQVATPDEFPSHLLVLQMIKNRTPETVQDVWAIEILGDCWYLLGRAWDNLCDAQKYEYSPYYILHAWEDLQTVVKKLKQLDISITFFRFNITQNGFDDRVADKVKELCRVVLNFAYDWDEDE